MPTFFWIGVSCIYVGIILLFVEIAIEPSVRQWTRDWRYFPHIWAMLCLIALGMFSTHVVFKSYALDALFSIPIQPKDGDVVAGIPWQPEFTESVLTLWNGSTAKFSGPDFLIRIDRPIIAAAVVGENSQSCSISKPDLKDGTIRVGQSIIGQFEMVATASGASRQLDLQIVASDVYRLICNDIRPQSSVNIQIITAHPSGGENAPQTKWLVIDNGKIIGFSDPLVYSRATPTKGLISGSFTGLKTEHIKQLFGVK